MPCRVRRTYEKTTSASSCDGSGLGPCRIQEPLYHFDIQGIVFVYQNVVIGMQDALPQIAPVPLKKGIGSGACRLPFFDHAFIPGYVRISFPDIGLAEHKADIGDLFDIPGKSSSQPKGI